MNCNFPVGKPIIIIGNDLKFVKIENECLTYHGNILKHGMIHCSVLAPQNLSTPYLQYRYKEEIYIALCRACAIKKSSKCQHRIKSRQFTSVWTIPDINYALTLGYTVQAVYEVHYFLEEKPVLQQFVRYLTAERLRNTCNLNGDSATSFCNLINSALELPQSFALTPSNVTNNKRKINFIN